MSWTSTSATCAASSAFTTSSPSGAPGTDGSDRSRRLTAKEPPALVGDVGLGGGRTWGLPAKAIASAGGWGSVRLPAPESFEVSWSEPLFLRAFSATLDSRRAIHASMREEDQPRCSAQAYAASHEPDSCTSVTNCSSVAAEGSPTCVCTIGGDATSSGSGAGTVSAWSAGACGVMGCADGSGVAEGATDAVDAGTITD